MGIIVRDNFLNRLIVVFISLFVIGSMFFYYLLNSYYTQEAYKKIRQNVVFSDAMREYTNHKIKPVINRFIKEKKLDDEFFDRSVMSSSYMISSIHKLYKDIAIEKKVNIDDIELKFASDNPTNPKNRATPFESEILKKFNNSNLTSYSDRISRNKKDTLFFAFPSERNSVECLKCHGNPSDAPKDMINQYGISSGFNEKIGEIRSLSAIYSVVDEDSEMMKFFIIVETLMFLTFIALYFSVRYFILELKQKDKFIAKQSHFAAMGEMIGMIAHQWRQPLTGMGMSVNNILLDIELQDVDERRLKESLEIINKQISYLSTTINDFQSFFKSDVKSETINIKKVIEDSCMIIDGTIKSNNMQIKLNINEEMLISTRKNELMQIILNLIKNSMEAYKDNNIQERVVEITATQNSQRVEIFVKDSAGGIPKEIIDKIFNPYFSTKSSKNGTGLGLYMSKMIVEEHLSGYLDVETHGSSTTFKISLIKNGAGARPDGN